MPLRHGGKEKSRKDLAPQPDLCARCTNWKIETRKIQKITEFGGFARGSQSILFEMIKKGFQVAFLCYAFRTS